MKTILFTVTTCLLTLVSCSSANSDDRNSSSSMSAGTSSGGGTPVLKPTLERVSHTGNIAPAVITICRLYPTGQLDLFKNDSVVRSGAIQFTSEIPNAAKMIERLNTAAKTKAVPATRTSTAAAAIIDLVDRNCEDEASR